MTDVLATPAPPAPSDDAEVKPLTFEEAVEQIDDGSRVVSMDTARELRDSLIKHTKSVINRAKGLTQARKEVAKDFVAARTLILLPNSLPDWGGASRAYSILASEVFDAVFGTNDADLRRTERAAINAHVQRTFLEPAIRAWVLENEKDAGGNKRFTEADDENNSPQFIAAVRKQYKQARQQNGDPLTPPDLYLTAQEKADRSLGRSGPGNGDKSALEVAMSGLEGLSGVTPLAQAVTILRGVSDAFTRLTDPKTSTVKDRGDVEEVFARVGDIAYVIAQYLHPGSQVSAGKMDEARALLYDAKTDGARI